MKLGVFAKIFAGKTPAAVLSAARRSGYETVQYNMACSGLSSLPPAISDEIAGAVQAASSETGVGIAAISATYNMIHPDLAEREKGRRGFQAIARSAHKLGSRLLTVCTGTLDPHDQWRYHPANSSAQAWEELCKEFRLLLAIAGKYDILIGVEPELANVVNSARRARDLLDTFGNGRIRIVFDAANLFDAADSEQRRSIIENAVDLLGDSIALAHAKDRLADGRFAPAGTGLLDYRHYLAALRKSGFDGSLVAHGMGSSEAESVAVFLKNELAVLEGKA
jgi:sugar phosphate isomerase/epimerase